MTKNLKKVISAVAALAISASAVSAFAVNFPDVATDASYAKAVQELSSLDIISGFDDGTFRPDELVTRAQITKMIVDALNERAQAEASKANSKFNDVSTDHWAKGYINQGVADQFIAGYSDTEFGPDDNVTYVQAQKMLVSAIGYETYAQGNGGWPNGYKQWAASTGITDGITGLNDDTQLTRAQVAQLIDNAMDAPVCVIDSWEPQWNGTQTPVLKIKNKHNGDDAEDYQTLFTLKHDAYKVYGRVEKTSKSGDNVDADKVNFTVEKSDNFDDTYIRVTNNYDNSRNEDMYFGDTNAVDLLLVYSEALIQKDNNDEFTILSITPVASTKAVTLAAEDFDDAKSADNPSKLYFYPAGSSRNSQKYSLAAGYQVYVNGVENDDLTDYDELVKYITKNDTAAVTLEKKSNTGSSTTSSDYNLVKISTYLTAIVSEVVEKNDTITVRFNTVEKPMDSKLELDTTNENLTYSFSLDGTEIEPTALEEDDVLSIAYDMSDDFKNSNFYDVLVSRDVVTGKVSSVSSDKEIKDKEYTVDNTKYKVVAAFNPELTAGNTYTMYLDHFGRVAKSEEDTDSKKLAILKNVYKRAGGDWYAQIITKDATEEEHKLDDSNVLKFYQIIDSSVKAIENVPTDGYTYGGAGKTKLDKYPDQVINYSVSSTDKITLKNNDAKTLAAMTKTGGEDSYKSSSNRVGSVRLSDASVVLDISEANDDEYSVASASSFVNDNKYTVYGYDKTTSGDTYFRFVLLTDGVGSFNSETQVAIFNGSKLVTVDEDDKTAYNLIVPDKETGDAVEDTYVLKEETIPGADDYEEGDALLFTTNASNEITAIEPLFTSVSALTGKDYNDIFKTVVTNTTSIVKDKATSGKDWNSLLDGQSDDINIWFGAAVNRRNNTITVVEPKAFEKDGAKIYAPYEGSDEAKNKDYIHEINTKDATIYTYDFSVNGRKNSKVLLDEGIQVSTETTDSLDKSGAINKLQLNHEDISDEVVFALVRADGDDAKEIYFIVSGN